MSRRIRTFLLHLAAWAGIIASVHATVRTQAEHDAWQHTLAEDGASAP